MFNTSMSPFAGLWNQVVLLMPETLMAFGIPGSTVACTPSVCSTDVYMSSFHTSNLSTTRFKSLKGIVVLLAKSGTDSESLGSTWLKEVPAHKMRPSTSNSSELTLAGSEAGDEQATCRKKLKCCRTNANIAVEASRPRWMELCAETPTRGEVPRGEVPRGEARGDETADARSKPGHISPDMAYWSVRTRCGQKTWHIMSKPMTLMSSLSALPFWPRAAFCSTTKICQ
mmetsp:Transcript_54330/g.176658  ORF Transcript_54330/g.176658 Transcript_54330/m.176658 type:complete len:228 (+) Transcript_54330:843-1526(+)